jgi:hypothetical protein
VNLGTNVNLYALGRHGKPIALGKVPPKLRLLSLSGSNFITMNKSIKGTNRVRWWNFATGKNGSTGTNEDVVGATPDGWIVEDPGFADGTHVVSRPESGSGIFDYGTPLTPGVDYGIAVGPSGFVAYADNFVNDNGEVTYTPWSPPARHRTLIAPGGKNARCDSVSSSYTGCVVGSGTARSVALIALSGHSRTTAGNRCADQLSVWGARIAWNTATALHSCQKGHVGAMTGDARTVVSKLRFDPRGVAAAWGQLVTSSRGQSALVTLTGVRARPSPLTRARV